MTVKAATAANYIDLLLRIDAALTGEGHAWGANYSGAGNGTLQAYAGGPATVAEAISIVATSATEFTVTGSVSGALGTATVGETFTTPKVTFKIVAGTVPFQAGDAFGLTTTPPWTRLRLDGSRGIAGETSTWNGLANAMDTLAYTAATANTLPAHYGVEMLRPIQVRAIRLQASQTPERMPTAWRLEYSDNGVDYETAHTWSGLTWLSGEVKTLVATAAGAHQWWRIVAITAGASTPAEVNGMDMYREPDDQWRLNRRAEFAWESASADGSRKCMVGGHTFENPGADTYNFHLFGFRAWDDKVTVGGQLNASTGKTVSLWNAPIPFWLFTNGQRTALVAKVSSSYQTAYLGFGLPYGTPSEHPHPLVIGGTGSLETRRWSDESANHRFFADPGEYGLTALMPGNTWVEFANRNDSTGSEDGGANDEAQVGKVLPYVHHFGTINTNTRQGIDGTIGLRPAEMIVRSPAHPWGEFDGVYWCSGFGGNGAESIVRWEGFDHLVVQNIARSGAQHYMAMRMD